MRHVRIFLLYFQDALESRSRSVVWFLILLINPLIYLLFWRGALGDSPIRDGSFSLSYIASYYFFLIIAGAFLQVHIEESVAYYDIQEGWLTNHLIRPYPYLWSKFFTEVPYRIIQAGFGVVVFVLFRFFYGSLISLETSLPLILLSILITAFGFWISFLFKMMLGLSALWTTDFTGLAQLSNVVILLTGGFIIPLDLLPSLPQRIIFFLPFPYMVYFPIVAWLGGLAVVELFRVILIQAVWVVGLAVVYRILWKRGLKKFTAVGM